MEIILQRGNANKIVLRFLRENLEPMGLRLASMDGGGLRNAIPREAKAVVMVKESQAKAFEAAAALYQEQIVKYYSAVENAIKFKVTPMEAPSQVLTMEDQVRIINALTAAPNGILRMSDSMKGLVETSTNMSRVAVADGKVEVLFMTRCMVNYGKRELDAMIRSSFELAGGVVTEANDYDGWAPNMASPVLATMLKGYQTLYGRTPEVKAIHAGLECGIIGSKYPELDMISIGPTIRFPHSPDEKVNIESVAKFYEFLLYTLKTI